MATSQANSPLARLDNHGQCYWLDTPSRRMLDDGSLERRIRDQGLSGVTSNPAIFAKAMLGEDPADRAAYDARIGVARRTTSSSDAEVGARAIYERLAVDDVRDACDLLLPRWKERINDGIGVDGCVSLEVSPHLAHDKAGTIAEARRLWDAVGRPNLLIKVPGTTQGLPAIETLLAEGITVNITLLFGLDAYEATLQAYLRALEQRLRDGRDVRQIGSVASFFLSRIDVAVDARVRRRVYPEVDEEVRRQAQSLLGRTALAAARLAYQRFREVLTSERWQHLAEHGAQPQRLLWASTGIKDPSLSDVHYIEPLIGPYTVSTIPEATADAFDDHGRVAATLAETAPDAEATLVELQRVLGQDGLVYLRTTRGKTPVIYEAKERFAVGGSKTLVASDEDELTLVAAGITVHTALEAVEGLRGQGLVVRVIDAYSVKPLDVATLKQAIEQTGALLVVEDHNRDGGLGDTVAAQVGRLGRVFHLGVAGEPHSGTPEELMERHRLSGEQIAREALALTAAA
jgi:transaldolase